MKENWRKGNCAWQSSRVDRTTTEFPRNVPRRHGQRYKRSEMFSWRLHARRTAATVLTILARLARPGPIESPTARSRSLSSEPAVRDLKIRKLLADVVDAVDKHLPMG